MIFGDLFVPDGRQKATKEKIELGTLLCVTDFTSGKFTKVNFPGVVGENNRKHPSKIYVDFVQFPPKPPMRS